MKCEVVIIDKEKNTVVNGVTCKTKKEAEEIFARIVDNLNLDIYTIRLRKLLKNNKK